jgi:hypothetical protein
MKSEKFKDRKVTIEYILNEKKLICLEDDEMIRWKNIPTKTNQIIYLKET